MSSELKLIVRTADQTRRAELDVAVERSGAELIQSAVDHWALPADADYTIVNVTTGRTLNPRDAIGQGARPGDLLEVQPVLVAGAAACGSVASGAVRGSA
jgi:hypothetical protein